MVCPWSTILLSPELLGLQEQNTNTGIFVLVQNSGFHCHVSVYVHNELWIYWPHHPHVFPISYWPPRPKSLMVFASFFLYISSIYEKKHATIHFLSLWYLFSIFTSIINWTKGFHSDTSTCAYNVLWFSFTSLLLFLILPPLALLKIL
jgi:hypothetical protein